jgi:hypothetical protein
MFVHPNVDVAVKLASSAAGVPLSTNFVSPDGKPLAVPFASNQQL